MDKRTILVVEDDPEVVRLYTEIFTHRGWRVVDARDGKRGIQAALEEQPAIILLDLMLPKEGGMHVLQVLKSLPETKKIPIVIVTAYPNPEYKENATKAGCDGYVVKGEVSHVALADFVEELLQRMGETQ